VKRPRETVRILIVAGSDSGGGAGIQADIKTATALGAYAMTAVTAVTVQDTTGVHSSHTVPPQIVADQIRVVLSDIGADVVKTGMLVSARTVEAVAKALGQHAQGVPLVVDTVMIAKGGAELVDDSGVDAMKSLLFPLAALITPNAPEAARLTGLRVDSSGDLIRAAEALRDVQKGAAVLVKGGHIEGDTITDVLADMDGVHIYRTGRIGTAPMHGTGCTLATAIAVGIGQGLPLRDAVSRARDYVQEAVKSGLAYGRGAGLLNHLHAIPPYEE
jgi:hydroxymethylpyrimidine/phosphomethylpyrimidine kinase